MSNEVPSALQAQLANLEALAAGQNQPPAQGTQEAPIQVAAQPIPEVSMSPAAAALSKTETDRQQQPAEDWQHKYKVANGMLQKTASEAKASREEVKRLQEELEKAKQVKPQQVANLSADPDTITDDELERLVKPNLLEEWGYDHWRQQIALMRSMVQATPAPNDDPRLETIEQEFKKQKKEAFYRELDRLVPQWEQINGTAQWNEFLSMLEPLTKVSYHGLLADATDSYDAHRVAEIFRAYSTRKQGDGFRNLVTPTPHAPSAQSFGTGQTLSFEQWNAELQALSSRGYSQQEILTREKNLMAMFREGRVTGVPGR